MTRIESRTNIAKLACFVGILSLCALFVLLASLWIDKPGIQTDEALFASGIYPPFSPESTVRIFKRDYPLMTMTYVGALKSYVWRFLFKIWPPSPASVRLPAILLGALSVWMTFALLRSSQNIKAAWIGAALIATDPIYILYSRWDHGPVVIQHLCLVTAMLAFVKFYQQRRVRWLALAMFVLGLGVWEKATFLWLISGLAIGGGLVFFREIRSLLSVRSSFVAAAAFSIGALPFIVYNLRTHYATFKGNAQWSSEGLWNKAGVLHSTLRGDVLFGSMMREDWDGPLRQPSTPGEKAVVEISMKAGMPRRHLLDYLFVLALLMYAGVNRGRTRMFTFLLLAMGIGWLSMALTKDAGAAAHHTILLWPMPQLAIASVLGASWPRGTWGTISLSSAVLIVCFANLLVLSTYYTNLIRNGGTSSWTDAMYPALDALRKSSGGAAVCTIDWGFFETLRLLHHGRTPLCLAADPVDEESRALLARQLALSPHPFFLSHTAGNETTPGVTERVVNFALSRGYRRIDHRLFPDSNGRETVEIFRFAPVVRDSAHATTLNHER